MPVATLESGKVEKPLESGDHYRREHVFSDPIRQRAWADLLELQHIIDKIYEGSAASAIDDFFNSLPADLSQLTPEKSKVR